MVDAFTFQSGNESKTFKNRKEMYDWMIENGHYIEEGDDAPKFKERVEVKVKQNNEKAQAIKSRLEA